MNLIKYTNLITNKYKKLSIFNYSNIYKIIKRSDEYNIIIFKYYQNILKKVL